MPFHTLSLHPYDIGLLRGYTVFDVMPTEHGRPFLWERHYERLVRSAESLGLSLPVDAEAYHHILAELIARNHPKKISLRTVLSGGLSFDTFTPVSGEESFFVFAEPAHVYADEVYTHGVKVITLEYERPLPQVKLANHVMAIQDLPRRREAKAFEVVYVNKGEVSEASQSNIFVMRNGTLVTTWDNVLWGITQGLVLELAEALGVITEKRAITIEELLSADEIFITGSSKRIIPVVQVDETIIGEGTPGPVTRRLMNVFDEFVKKH